jgi:hypothetical protein
MAGMRNPSNGPRGEGAPRDSSVCSVSRRAASSGGRGRSDSDLLGRPTLPRRWGSGSLVSGPQSWLGTLHRALPGVENETNGEVVPAFGELGHPPALWAAVHLSADHLGRALSTRPGPYAIGAERSVAVSSGTSFAQVVGAILKKQARVQNPAKDEVTDRGIGCADPAGQRLQARRNRACPRRLTASSPNRARSSPAARHPCLAAGRRPACQRRPAAGQALRHPDQRRCHGAHRGAAGGRAQRRTRAAAAVGRDPRPPAGVARRPSGRVWLARSIPRLTLPQVGGPCPSNLS